MYDWKTEIRSYSQTTGYEMDDYDSYFLNLETSGQESVAIPFLHWRAHYYSRRPWWQDYDLVAEGTETQPGLDVLNYIQITSDDEDEEFFHLILPNFDRYNQTFIDFNQTFIDLKEQYRDDVKPQDLLAEVVRPDVSYSYEASNFDVTCMLHYETDPQSCSPQSGDPIDVPEGSSVVGIVAIGLALVGMAIRRSFFQRA
ncbi:hypothetical protein PJF56_20900 [Roseofilum sp. BLCC_M91]|uniref:PEP-CTERM sorting domain-containing protein n=1 Tax=Roseofilum halophilum BLCC-M91 TaxID=3022259 RepID=A0ABT7BQH5_9CYAN|nr:hypothetical protein [Roseofilum halophilum]MDJ1181325.1 hypothetical protein [Roseofilum halophilum BLCC-M91]